MVLIYSAKSVTILLIVGSNTSGLLHTTHEPFIKFYIISYLRQKEKEVAVLLRVFCPVDHNFWKVVYFIFFFRIISAILRDGVSIITF